MCTRSPARCQACLLASLLACGPTLPYYHFVMLRLWLASLGSWSLPACTSITGPNFLQDWAITRNSPRSVSIWPALAFLIFNLIVFILPFFKFARATPTCGDFFYSPCRDQLVRQLVWPSRAYIQVVNRHFRTPLRSFSCLTPDPSST